MQVKTTMKFDLVPVRKIVTQKLKTKSANREVGEAGRCTTGGMSLRTADP